MADPRTINTRDDLSKGYAEELAARITRYWRKRGLRVTTRVESFAGSRDRWPMYCVRSDMINGSPRASAETA